MPGEDLRQNEEAPPSNELASQSWLGAAQTWVAGVDGCRAGWLAVVRPLATPVGARVHLMPTFADVLNLAERPRVIAIDIPIGLPEVAMVGGRHADIAARARLGARRSAVFAVPARLAVLEADYRAACAVARATSEPPRSVSKQTFNLFPKMREVDALITPALQERVVECHPEVAFWALNGEQPLGAPKKTRSQAHPAGLALRRFLLAQAGYSLAFLQAVRFKAHEAGPDDFLDACACSWSAARIASGRGVRFPAEPPVDGKGLRMEIWV
jgi:predicted RNase H-like nuclease